MDASGNKTDVKRRFGAAVRARRRLLGLSQERLAERAGLHRTYVAEVELGKRNVSLVNIERLAAALAVSIPGLFSEAEERPERAAEEKPEYGV